VCSVTNPCFHFHPPWAFLLSRVASLFSSCSGGVMACHVVCRQHRPTPVSLQRVEMRSHISTTTTVQKEQQKKKKKRATSASRAHAFVVFLPLRLHPWLSVSRLMRRTEQRAAPPASTQHTPYLEKKKTRQRTTVTTGGHLRAIAMKSELTTTDVLVCTRHSPSWQIAGGLAGENHRRAGLQMRSAVVD
jgi:hypothetical protein